MLTIRKSDDRGFADHGWLRSYHTFSFANYHDPEQMGFRALRVINEDFIAPGQGFGMHPHRDMEIISVVVSGSLEHRDNMGNGSTIHAGEIQVMTAGSGVLHSEFNPSETESTHLLQIWITPNAKGLKPSYREARLTSPGSTGGMDLLVSADGRDGSLTINQDCRLFRAELAAGRTLEYALPHGRHAWIQVISGELASDRARLSTGDGARISDSALPILTASQPTQLLLFDLA